MSQIKTKFITDLAVTTAKINADAVTTAKILDANVTSAKIASGVDAVKIGAGSVDNTEFGYLDGVTSAIQTQFSGKVPNARLINTPSLGGLSGGGDLSADRSLLVDPNNATSVAAAAGDFVLIADVSDSNNVKKVTVSSIVALASDESRNKETFTLSAGDITNQYIDLANVAKTFSIHFIVKGGAPTLEGASHDYSVNYTGGAGGNTRISFLNDLATGGAAALIAGDIVQVVYEY